MRLRWQLFVFAISLTIFQINAEGETEKKCILCDGQDCLSNFDTSKTCTSKEKCFTLVENNGNVKRGCVDDTNKCDSKNCRTCDAATDKLCNNLKDDKDLFFCKTCDSTSACANAKDSISNEICTAGVTKCLTQIKDKQTYRKCATNNDEECKEDQKCVSCGTRSCNKEIYPSNRRKCYQCKAGDTNCSSPTSEMSYVCQIYEESDKCYQYGTSDATMTRGCKSDKTDFEKCTSDNKCKECDADGCNSDKFTSASEFSCYKCRSDENTNCTAEWKADLYKSEKCRNEIKSDDDKKCYVEIYDNIVYRSCIVDTDPKTKKNCLNTDYKDCQICTGENCNKDKAPNSAYNIALTSVLLATCLMVLRFF